jgi:hypothetical protein
MFPPVYLVCQVPHLASEDMGSPDLWSQTLVFNISLVCFCGGDILIVDITPWKIKVNKYIMSWWGSCDVLVLRTVISIFGGLTSGACGVVKSAMIRSRLDARDPKQIRMISLAREKHVQHWSERDHSPVWLHIVWGLPFPSMTFPQESYLWVEWLGTKPSRSLARSLGVGEVMVVLVVQVISIARINYFGSQLDGLGGRRSNRSGMKGMLSESLYPTM